MLPSLARGVNSVNLAAICGDRGLTRISVSAGATLYGGGQPGGGAADRGAAAHLTGGRYRAYVGGGEEHHALLDAPIRHRLLDRTENAEDPTTIEQLTV